MIYIYLSINPNCYQYIQKNLDHSYKRQVLSKLPHRSKTYVVVSWDTWDEGEAISAILDKYNKKECL